MSNEGARADGVRGGRRGDRARETRRRIIGSAHDLFLRQGYAGTTLEEIAAASGVAVQTVYFHFQNKRTVLKHVVDVASVGDDRPVALLERSWMTEMRQAPDARAALAVWLEMSREIFARVVPIMTVVHEAAGSDPDMAAQQQVNRAQTLTAHRTLAEHLAGRGALRDGLGVEEAGERLYALISLDLYVLFTTELGWPPERWQAWTADAVERTVLR